MGLRKMKTLKKVLAYVREFLGEGAYARYYQHLLQAGRAEAIPTPENFYLESLRRRYSKPSRCC